MRDLKGSFAVMLFTAAIAQPQSALSQEAGVFSLPSGCSAWVTVQSKDCTVEHNFTCEGDPAGEKQRVALDEQGMTYLGATDDESQWLRSFHPRSGHSERLEDNPTDPASFSELIETGIDTYDFVTLSDELGPTRFVGQDNLTGRVVTIDEVTLEETQYNITAYDADGNEMWSSSGNEYIHRDWRMFQAGPGTVTTPDGTYDEDDSPVEFIFPGEPGFMSANPKHGCGVVMSSSPVATLKEILNVEL
jgi:hypothetical protein